MEPGGPQKLRSRRQEFPPTLIPMRSPFTIAALGILGASLAPSTPARACGGMVFPGHAQRVGGMSQQEVFVAFTDKDTTVVASAGYEGIDAADFAFLLPLPEEPVIVIEADPALFQALDEYTAPTVETYTFDSGSGSGGFGCGAGLRNDAAPGSGSGSSNGEVMVGQRGQTASYDWVVLGGTTGMAVAEWLEGEGYPLPADYATAIQPYVDDSFFFAAKVRSEAIDGALRPIELHLHATMPEAFEIPFGLAAHSLSPGQDLGITTYLWYEGAILPENYGTGFIGPEEVTALSETETDYAQREQEILDSDPDGVWIIDFSGHASAANIEYAYSWGVDEGRIDPTSSNPAFLDDFFIRYLEQDEGHLTRLRARLTAEQLRDLRLRRSAGTEVSNIHLAYYEADDDDSSESGTCTVGSRRRLPLGLVLLLPLVAWLRPRRALPL